MNFTKDENKYYITLDKDEYINQSLQIFQIMKKLNQDGLMEQVQFMMLKQVILMLIKKIMSNVNLKVIMNY